MAAGDHRVPGANVGRQVAGALVMEGRFQISQLLSVAGLRALYLALETATRRPRFVLEFALPTEARRSGGEDSLIRIRHPLLPSIGEYYADASVMLVALNLAEGTVLSDVLERQPGQQTSERQAIAWGMQLCDGLGYLHQQTPPVVVADLAPSALLVTAPGQLKLIGLGTVIGLYTPASIIGALEPGYAAPEVYAGHVDQRGDIYALGALLFRILTGADPANYAPGALPPLRALRPSLSAEIEAAVARALALDPAARWPDAGGFAAALDAAVPWMGVEGPVTHRDSAALLGPPANLAEPSTWHDEPSLAPAQWHDPLAGAAPAEEAGIVPEEVFGDRGREPAPSHYSEQPPAPPTLAPAPAAPPQAAPGAPIASSALGAPTAATPSSEPAPSALPRVTGAPAPTRRAPPAEAAPMPLRGVGLFGRIFGGGARERRAPQEVAATGTVMLPRHMQRKRRYTITIRIVGKQPEAVHAVAFTDAAQVGKRGLGKLPKGAHIIVEATQSGDAFELPQPRVALDVPAPDALSEARMPVIARRLSASDMGDRLTFTFRGPNGETLHAEPLSADVLIVEAVSGASTDILTLVHQITVLV
ncbi:MAG TPA: protein kinase [Ktedonobacterales bacterium]